ncbi:hypothetical protein ACFRDV_33615, partial [Streptomyces fagopyri]
MPTAEGAPGTAPAPAASEDRSAVRRSTATDATEADGQVAPAAGAARPGDVAREALRAARSEARQARADAGGEEAEEPRRRFADRTPPSTSPARRTPRGHDPEAPARDVRDLLAGAFELPGDEDPRTRTTRVPGPDAPPLPDGRTVARPETSDTGTGSRRAAHSRASREDVATSEPAEDTRTAGSTTWVTRIAGAAARVTGTAGSTPSGARTAGDTDSAGSVTSVTRTAGEAAGDTGTDGSTARYTESGAMTPARYTEAGGPVAGATDTAGAAARDT